MHVGTSGFSYDEWVGPFYPAEIGADQRLAYYGERFSTVEINNTFYRMPKREVLERWSAAVPDSFRFVIKASRAITHKGRLSGVEDSVQYLLGQLETLGDKCGPILFQTPPYLRKGLERLDKFAALLPEGVRAAFEFRHDSWDDPEVHEVLSKGGHAVCIGELDEVNPERSLPRTAPWAVLRLHVRSYTDEQLEAWADRIAETWDEAFVFFKHETTGPELARRMIAIAQARGIEV